ncbi:hypothetical protein KKH59_00765, partial [Patescibacteria group bacterium]|nr:hypothetical protein [Patescibacteria group bacterium]
ECAKSEKRKELGPLFWDNYQKIKEFKHQMRQVPGEISLENRGRNNLIFLGWYAQYDCEVAAFSANNA